jgi:hypothetical protein
MKSRGRFADKVASDNEREKSRGSGYGYLLLPRGISIFKVEGGDRVSLDFLPYIISDENHPCRNDEKEVALPGDMWYRRPFKLHRNIGSSNESVVCPTSFGKKCPVCEYRTKLLKEGKKFDDDEVKAIKPSDRNLYVVVPIGNKEEKGIHIFDISRACFQDKLREETDEKPEFRAFFDPSDEGFTVSIRFSKEQIGKNSFADASRIDFFERKQGEGYDDDYLKDVPDLDKMLNVYPYEKIHNLFYELGEEKDEKETNKDPDETPRRRDREELSSKEEPPARRRNREEDDDNNEVKERVERAGRGKDKDDEPKRICISCDGSGEDSKGRVCPICRGTGKRVVKEKEEEKPKTSTKKEEEKSTSECPFGYEFGVHCDRKSECDDCKIWEKCYERKKELKSKG